MALNLNISSALLVSVGSTFAMSAAVAQPDAQEIHEQMLQSLDPDLMRRAENQGIYDRDALPVLRSMNPFFLRGDFNGDGEMDLAFWVWNPQTRQRGVAILHSTLDRLYVFGAGQPRPAPADDSKREVSVDAWRLLPAGQTESHPYGDIPEIGLRAGDPFRFERETLEFNYLGKSAFVFYWSAGQYWEFGTAD